ncbi:MAG TPA: hypothetical protein DCO86_04825, partial [Spirochaetaceae bacterium]|nr:hypothetical protein [Spirochaetaceae bacterium]
LSLYRDMRYSVNPSFDCELFLTNLARIKVRLSNFEIAKRLAAYETAAPDDQTNSDESASQDREAQHGGFAIEGRHYAEPSSSGRKATAKTAHESRNDDIRANSEEREFADDAAEHDIVLDIFKDGLTDPI